MEWVGVMMGSAEHRPKPTLVWPELTLENPGYEHKTMECTWGEATMVMKLGIWL